MEDKAYLVPGINHHFLREGKRKDCLLLFIHKHGLVSIDRSLQVITALEFPLAHAN